MEKTKRFFFLSDTLELDPQRKSQSSGNDNFQTPNCPPIPIIVNLYIPISDPNQTRKNF